MLLSTSANGIATLTLNRPDRGNALSDELVVALLEQVETVVADRSIHTLVLAANGSNFCTGFDLSNLAQSSAGDLLQRFVHVEQLLQALWHAPIRTVAMAQGRAWGAGADLVAACELRQVRDDASFRFPGARFGIVLGSRRLAERVGSDSARRWVLDGAHVTASEAQAAGLVTSVHSADTFDGLLTSVPTQLADRETGSAIRALTRRDDADRDLAALVRSASRPGLKGRIEAYMASLRKS